MHLRSTATEQINEGGVKRHNGVSQMHAVLFMLLLAAKPARRSSGREICVSYLPANHRRLKTDVEELVQQSNICPRSTYMKRRSFLTVGPSLAGSSEILMASSMAASRPLPPSPLRAGPKHSGRRIRSRTTTLAFSSTLSPARVSLGRFLHNRKPGEYTKKRKKKG